MPPRLYYCVLFIRTRNNCEPPLERCEVLRAAGLRSNSRQEPSICVRNPEEFACTRGAISCSLLHKLAISLPRRHSSIASRSLVPLASVRQPVARSKPADRSTSVRRCGAHQAQAGIDSGSVCARSLTVLAEMIAPWSSPHLCKLPCHWQCPSGRASSQSSSSFRRSDAPHPCARCRDLAHECPRHPAIIGRYTGGSAEVPRILRPTPALRR